ncbi:hypothetical protein TNCT_594461 [Trichonephila clavata]|uniref:Uncharacterized protein n=1 Tax=Trichonephila clavata TaxID=2740835 RepID=A0A8X6HCF7_TRICU|nr:hypothetical protein TNCT_594461 [Trichonephila clavata]
MRNYSPNQTTNVTPIEVAGTGKDDDTNVVYEPTSPTLPDSVVVQTVHFNIMISIKMVKSYYLSPSTPEHYPPLTTNMFITETDIAVGKTLFGELHPIGYIRILTNSR